MIFVSNCPARPTKGLPWASSSAPGASPTKTNCRAGTALAENKAVAERAEGAAPAIAHLVSGSPPGWSGRHRKASHDRICTNGFALAAVVVLSSEAYLPVSYGSLHRGSGRRADTPAHGPGPVSPEATGPGSGVLRVRFIFNSSLASPFPRPASFSPGRG